MRIVAPDSQSLQAARTFLRRIAGRYPVSQAWLYGSRARGEARPDSDLDIALILDGPRTEMRLASVELAGDAFDTLIDTGLFPSPLAISMIDWQAPESFSNPFLIINIRRDGILL